MSTTTTRSPVFIPDNLLVEFLSLLPVKSLLRFKCVSNSWNTLISHPDFVKFHLNKSTSRNPHFTLITQHLRRIKRAGCKYDSDEETVFDHNITPCPISSFLDNPSLTLTVDHCYFFSQKVCSGIAGYCNGLVCLTSSRFCYKNQIYEYWLRLWNPATRALSKNFGYFRDCDINFNFGCDSSTGTYKVIASRYIHGQLTSEVKVLELFSDNVWRHIENFPVVPLHLNGVESFEPNGVFFNGTINWLAIHSDTPYTYYYMREQEKDWYYDELEGCFVETEKISTKHFVILSLDLGIETYNQYMLPQGFDEVPPAEPTVSVLGDRLCFSYSYPETDLIIWQMTMFGDEKSWNQFLKISYHDLQLNYDFSTDTYLKYYLRFRPWFLSKDGNMLILSIRGRDSRATLYNLRDQRVERAKVSVLWRDQRVERAKVSVHKTIIDDINKYDHICWHYANNFVESLIPIC